MTPKMPEKASMNLVVVNHLQITNFSIYVKCIQQGCQIYQIHNGLFDLGLRSKEHLTFAWTRGSADVQERHVTRLNTRTSAVTMLNGFI